MSEAEKLKKEWFTLLNAINSVCELEDSIEQSEMFSMMLSKKSKIEKELSKHYKIVQLTTLSLEPLNQNQP